MTSRVPVTFEPAGVTTWVVAGTTLTDAARQAGIMVPAPCGGRGVCGSCGVSVLAGALASADEAERAMLVRARPGIRLACRATVVGPVTVRPLALDATSVQAPALVGSMAAGPLVAGVDLGTTSVAVALVDPRTGRELARASVANRQQRFGADVLARLSAA